MSWPGRKSLEISMTAKDNSLAYIEKNDHNQTQQIFVAGIDYPDQIHNVNC